MLHDLLINACLRSHNHVAAEENSDAVNESQPHGDVQVQTVLNPRVFYFINVRASRAQAMAETMPPVRCEHLFFRFTKTVNQLIGGNALCKVIDRICFLFFAHGSAFQTSGESVAVVRPVVSDRQAHGKTNATAARKPNSLQGL